MSRPFTPKILTANALLAGDVVYLTAQGTWSSRLEDAVLVQDQASAEHHLSAAQNQPDQIVGAYLMDAQAGPNGPEPLHFREDFRRTGPSNYPHGKQADLTGA